MHHTTECVTYQNIDAEECSTFQDYPVQSYIRHPGFDCSIDGVDNIGLVRLKTNVRYSGIFIFHTMYFILLPQLLSFSF